MNDNGVGQDDEDDDTDADDEDADVADEEVVNAHDDDGNNTDTHYYHNYNNGKHSDDSSISDKKGPGAATANAEYRGLDRQVPEDDAAVRAVHPWQGGRPRRGRRLVGGRSAGTDPAPNGRAP